MELIKYKTYLLDKNKQYILRIPMIRVTSIFKLVHVDTAYITPISIDGATDFSDLINNYSRYHHIDICVQKKDVFQNLINFQIKIKI